MKYVYLHNQAKEIDHHAISVMGFPSLVLMERAAMSVAAVIMEKELNSAGILAVCGMGNNGGDAVAVARILRQNGYQAAICMVGDPEKMTEETKTQLKMASNCDVPMVKAEAIAVADVIVDGLFGIGLTRELNGIYEDVIGKINDSVNRVYAVDIPSGVSASTGRLYGVAVKADVTVTLGVNKVGLVIYPGKEYAGDVVVADIGLPKESIIRVENPTYYYELEDLYRIPERKNYSNKGTFGKVLVVGGSTNMTGAVYLSAKAAYTVGAGMVKMVTLRENKDVLLGLLPEALFADFTQLEESMNWADVIIVGPGLGLSEEAKAVLEQVLTEREKPIIVDGDGITLYAKTSKELQENLVFTPHIKEYSRLFGESVEKVRENLMEFSRVGAQQKKGIMVLKDARTLVSDGDEVYINISGNNAMAKAGSGDVLTGVIGGLMAQGMTPFEAAKIGTYLHGLAGDTMAALKGQYSVMASDLIEGICEVLQERQ